MKRLLKKLLGITELEARVDALEAEKSQTSENAERDKPFFGSMMTEWLNGAEGSEDQ